SFVFSFSSLHTLSSSIFFFFFFPYFSSLFSFFFFFFNDTATTEIYTLSLHDALPICHDPHARRDVRRVGQLDPDVGERRPERARSEEHTSELQSPCNLVCRLLLEKKKKKTST